MPLEISKENLALGLTVRKRSKHIFRFHSTDNALLDSYINEFKNHDEIINQYL